MKHFLTDTILWPWHGYIPALCALQNMKGPSIAIIDLGTFFDSGSHEYEEEAHLLKDGLVTL
jgi:hypothetical protein